MVNRRQRRAKAHDSSRDFCCFLADHQIDKRKASNASLLQFYESRGILIQLIAFQKLLALVATDKDLSRARQVGFNTNSRKLLHQQLITLQHSCHPHLATTSRIPLHRNMRISLSRVNVSHFSFSILFFLIFFSQTMTQTCAHTPVDYDATRYFLAVDGSTSAIIAIVASITRRHQC